MHAVNSCDIDAIIRAFSGAFSFNIVIYECVGYKRRKLESFHGEVKRLMKERF